MKNVICYLLLLLPVTVFSQRVGVNTNTPSGTVEIVGNELNITALSVENTSGIGVDVDIPSPTNNGIGLRIENAGIGRSLQVISTSTTTTNEVGYFSNSGMGRTIEVFNNNLTNNEIVFYLENFGASPGMFIRNSELTNNEAVIEGCHDGLGIVMNLESTNDNNDATTLNIKNNSITTNTSLGYGIRVRTDAARASYFTNNVGNVNSCGLYGRNESPDGIGVASAGIIASDGGETGNVAIYAFGEIVGSSKSFMIDHPVDPANKLLKHFSIESDEALLIYRGQAELDNQGRAMVQLKDYQNAIIKNVTYNLTAIGSPTVFYVDRELDQQGQFIIAGNNPGATVNWTIYAQRDDAYFKTYPSKQIIEIEKPDDYKGTYIHPVAHGKSMEHAMDKPDNHDREEN